MTITKREVIAELRGRVNFMRRYEFPDHRIRCLEVALLCVKERKWPRGKK